MFSLVFFTGRKKRCAEIVLSSDIKSFVGENKVKAKWNGKWCVARVLQEHDDREWLKSFIVTSDGELLDRNLPNSASTTPAQNSRSNNLTEGNFLKNQARKVVDHNGTTTFDATDTETPIIPEDTDTGHAGVTDLTIDQLPNVAPTEKHIEMHTILSASMQTPVIYEITTSNAPDNQPPIIPHDTNPGHGSVTIITTDQLPNIPENAGHIQLPTSLSASMQTPVIHTITTFNAPDNQSPIIPDDAHPGHGSVRITTTDQLPNISENQEHIEMPTSFSAPRETPVIHTPDYCGGHSQNQENRVLSDGFTLSTTAEPFTAASMKVSDGSNDALDLCIPRNEENTSVDQSNAVIESCTSTMVEFGSSIQSIDNELTLIDKFMNPIDLSQPHYPMDKIAEYSALLKPRKDNDCRIISTLQVDIQGSGSVLGLPTPISPATEVLPVANTSFEVDDCTTGTTSELSEDDCVIIDEIKAKINSVTDSAASSPKYCRISGTTVADIHISADDRKLADSNHIPMVHPNATNTLHLPLDDDCVIIEKLVETDGAVTLQNRRTSEESEIRVLSVAEINGTVDIPLERGDQKSGDEDSDDEIQIIHEGIHHDELLAQHALGNNEQMGPHNNHDMVQLVPGNDVAINRYTLETLIRDYGHDSAALGRELFITFIGRERLLTMTATGRGGFNPIPPRILNAVEDYIIWYTNNQVDHTKFRRRVAQLLNGLRKRE